MNIYTTLTLLALLLCVACDKPLPTLEGVDIDAWQQDKHGCKGTRNSMKRAMDAQKEKLLSLGQMQIVELLGRPDENELSSRNQKLFYYFIDPGPACDGATDSLAAKLAIRFNAVGLAKEVGVVRGKW